MLKLYNIKLEEQILSLENEIPTLKNKLSHTGTPVTLHQRVPGLLLTKSSYAQALSGESNRAPATATGKFSHTRVFTNQTPPMALFHLNSARELSAVPGARAAPPHRGVTMSIPKQHPLLTSELFGA